MNELAEDRAVVCSALRDHGIEGWVFEIHAEARAASIRESYLEEVAASDVYVGLFYKTLGRATAEEFEYASSLAKPLLIFEKSASDDERTPELRAFLADLNNIHTGVTVKRYRSSQDDLSGAIKVSIARLLADAFHCRSSQSPLRAAHALIHPDEWNALAKLWNGVVVAVADGLRSPLAPMHGLSPQRILQPRLVSPPGVEGEAMAADQPLAAEQSFKALFQNVQNSLLILGGPGGGKTIALLQLADQLMPSRAELATSRLPVLLRLSSWKPREREFAAWITRAIAERYFCRSFVRNWIERGRLIYLLDGLDDIPVEHRTACIAAINEFALTTDVAIAVTCRSGDYKISNAPLALTNAVSLQPLEPDRVDSYLQDKGPGLAFLRSAIRNDPLWLELVQSPLILSVMVALYDRLTPEELNTPAQTTKEARQAFLWDRYLETRIERKPRKYADSGSEQIRSGLQWLASHLAAHNQSTCYLERLQPSWLDSAGGRWAYSFLTRVAAATVVGIAFSALVILGSALSCTWQYGRPDSGGAGGLLRGLGCAISATPQAAGDSVSNACCRDQGQLA